MSPTVHIGIANLSSEAQDRLIALLSEDRARAGAEDWMWQLAGVVTIGDAVPSLAAEAIARVGGRSDQLVWAHRILKSTWADLGPYPGECVCWAADGPLGGLGLYMQQYPEEL